MGTYPRDRRRYQFQKEYVEPCIKAFYDVDISYHASKRLLMKDLNIKYCQGDEKHPLKDLISVIGMKSDFTKYS